MERLLIWRGLDEWRAERLELSVLADARLHLYENYLERVCTSST